MGDAFFVRLLMIIEIYDSFIGFCVVGLFYNVVIIFDVVKLVIWLLWWDSSDACSCT